MTREIINIKINKVMTRKKRTKEEQPLTTEVVGAKKKSPKKACYCSRTGRERKRAYCPRRSCGEYSREKRVYH